MIRATLLCRICGTVYIRVCQVDCDESEALIESTKLGMIEDRFSKEWCSIALEMTKGDVSLAAEFLEKADTLVTGSDPYAHPNPKQVGFVCTILHPT